MKTLAIVTSTRAEYGLLRPLILRCRRCNDFSTKLIVTGTHLHQTYGMTYREIEADGIYIDRKVNMDLYGDDACSVTKSMGMVMVQFAVCFKEMKPDAIVVLGDRYEILAVCIAAMQAGIPIFHIHGGEITEGAVDEAIRHSVTKMSYLHFASSEVYRKRIVQLGEDPRRVYNVGALGIENIKNIQYMSKKEIASDLGLDMSRKTAVITYHPTTLDTENEQVEELFCALSVLQDWNLVFTKANADVNGQSINDKIDLYVEENKNAYVFASLGTRRYLSLLSYSEVVIGNSSSGIIEAPYLGVPTVNIGSRQRGRIQAKSIVNCDLKKDSIIKAIECAISSEEHVKIKSMKCPYGDGNTSSKIVEIIRGVFEEGISLQKKFYDIDFVL